MSVTLCVVQRPSATWVRTAHGDAWRTLGVAAVAELPGVRLMATGLPHPQWNNGDVDDPSAVDIGVVRDWYADLGLPWGMRVPAGAPWPHGRRLFTKRLMGLTPEAFIAAVGPDGVEIRAATRGDLDEALEVDTVAFDEAADVERPWLELLLRHPAVTTAVATDEGGVVGVGSVTVSDGRAGRTGYVAGIAVLPRARRRGIGAALSAWLVATALSDGVGLCHLHPDTEDAARIYRRLGFAEVDGLDIYVDN
jgi:ribosomal protein S18 acetylase RimI-like enzyme